MNCIELDNKIGLEVLVPKLGVLKLSSYYLGVSCGFTWISFLGDYHPWAYF